MAKTRHSHRYFGYTRVLVREYQWALIFLIQTEASDLISALNCSFVLDDLDNRINTPQTHAAWGRITQGITSIGVFGSLARGENKPDSDVDIVVTMSKPDLFYMVHIKEELETAYQTKVDIVHHREKMNKFLKRRIDRDAVYV